MARYYKVCGSKSGAAQHPSLPEQYAAIAGQVQAYWDSFISICKTMHCINMRRRYADTLAWYIEGLCKQQRAHFKNVERDLLSEIGTLQIPPLQNVAPAGGKQDAK